MILDIIENTFLYDGLGPRIAAGLEWLCETDLAELEPGRYEIRGDECYALVMNYETRPKEQGAWEAHRKYIDIQHIISGTELMGYAHIEGLNASTDYDEAKDAIILTGSGDFLTVSAGGFVIFYPHDAHMPSISAGSPQPVKKAVIKVRV